MNARIRKKWCRHGGYKHTRRSKMAMLYMRGLVCTSDASTLRKWCATWRRCRVADGVRVNPQLLEAFREQTFLSDYFTAMRCSHG